jgi:hypothetical protein
MDGPYTGFYGYGFIARIGAGDQFYVCVVSLFHLRFAFMAMTVKEDVY